MGPQYQSESCDRFCSFLRLGSKKNGAKGMSEQIKTIAARLIGHLLFSIVK